jgi:ABC-type uncharacterized transport system permease subunit
MSLVTEHVIILYLISHLFMTVTVYQVTAMHNSTVNWLSDNMQNVLILIYEFFSSTMLIFQESNQITEQNKPKNN